MPAGRADRAADRRCGRACGLRPAAARVAGACGSSRWCMSRASDDRRGAGRGHPGRCAAARQRQPRTRRSVLGGTGRVHDWAISRRIVEASPVPVFLAGGLTPANVTEAIRSVRPFGVDLCTGLRTEGDSTRASSRPSCRRWLRPEMIRVRALRRAGARRAPAGSPPRCCSSAARPARPWAGPAPCVEQGARGADVLTLTPAAAQRALIASAAMPSIEKLTMAAAGPEVVQHRARMRRRPSRSSSARARQRASIASRPTASA